MSKYSIYFSRVILLLFICLPLFFKIYAQQPNPALVGYWHNWNDANAPYIPLTSIDNRYDIIHVAFAIPLPGTDYHMTFTPDQGTQAAFINQITTLKNQGKKVLISIGGATAPISLDNITERNIFISTLTGIINNYGFDGIDIDLEGSSVTVTGGTIAAPVDPKIINLIEAVKQIMTQYSVTNGKKMMLTMAPETAFVQGGIAAYGSIWGAYLPVIHALRDSLDILHVQLYNSGSMYGADGNIYEQGTADFVVAMTDAVIKGFNTAGGFFKGLYPSQVAVGLPACPSAAGGGYLSPSQVKSAIDYLRGSGPKPGNYQLSQFGGYPDLRGMMTWSINWDAVSACNTSYEYADTYEIVFDDSLYYSMRFTATGNQTNQNVDRVVIPIDNPHKPVDVGQDFTLEFWMKANPGDNPAGDCTPVQWKNGNIIVDRDVYGDGDYGDYGVSICNRKIVVGIQRGSMTHSGVSGSITVDDGKWHHIAITRNALTGGVGLYIDGTLDISAVTGNSTLDISYRDGRQTSYPDDPSIVIGAEKHDLPNSLHYKGRIDDLRISEGIIYTTSFSKPWKPFISSAVTKGLYHFDEGNGMVLNDYSNAAGGISPGTILYGGNISGPFWSYDTPFQQYIEVTNTLDNGAGSLREAVANATAGSIIVFSPYLNNDTIVLNSTLSIGQNVIIRDFNAQSVKLTIAGAGPVITIPLNKKVVLWDVDLISGTGTTGRAITNQGMLVLRNAHIMNSNSGIGSSVLNSGSLIIQDSVILD